MLVEDGFVVECIDQGSLHILGPDGLAWGDSVAVGIDALGARNSGRTTGTSSWAGYHRLWFGKVDGWLVPERARREIFGHGGPGPCLEELSFHFPAIDAEFRREFFHVVSVAIVTDEENVVVELFCTGVSTCCQLFRDFFEVHWILDDVCVAFDDIEVDRVVEEACIVLEDFFEDVIDQPEGDHAPIVPN